MEEDIFDFPCSATFRHYYAEKYYGCPRIDYQAQDNPRRAVELDDPFDFNSRLAAAERRINHLYALSAMRSAEVAELAQRRRKPKY